MTLLYIYLISFTICLLIFIGGSILEGSEIVVNDLVMFIGISAIPVLNVFFVIGATCAYIEGRYHRSGIGNKVVFKRRKCDE